MFFEKLLPRMARIEKYDKVYSTTLCVVDYKKMDKDQIRDVRINMYKFESDHKDISVFDCRSKKIIVEFFEKHDQKHDIEELRTECNNILNSIL